MSRSIGIVPEPAPNGGFGPGLAGFARQLWWERRWRTRFFPAELFGEPSWDLLLAAYGRDRVSEAADTNLGRRKPHLAACVPPRVATRHLRELVGLGLVESASEGNTASGRLGLTPEAHEKMGMLLANFLLQRTLAVLPSRGGLGEEGGAANESDPGLRLALLMARLLECLDELDRLGFSEAGAHLSLAIATLERHTEGSSQAHR